MKNDLFFSHFQWISLVFGHFQTNQLTVGFPSKCEPIKFILNILKSQEPTAALAIPHTAGRDGERRQRVGPARCRSRPGLTLLPKQYDQFFQDD